MNIDDRAHDTGSGPGTPEWWADWEEWVGPDLLGGYATLVYLQRRKLEDIP